jgi:hypothetical protein
VQSALKYYNDKNKGTEKVFKDATLKAIPNFKKKPI